MWWWRQDTPGWRWGTASRRKFWSRPPEPERTPETQPERNTMTSLQDLKVGQSAQVRGFIKEEGNASRAYRQKLLSMGLTPGTEFRVTRVAPMGDPVEIIVRGFSLSLRRDEAATLLVNVVDAGGGMIPS
jgi:ferrous iron transport protein A